MTLEIKQVLTKKDYKRFVQFAIDLFEGNEYYCPPLIFDEINTFNPQKNPAYETCESICFLALRDGKPVGRIAGIINHAANKQWNTNRLRFGYFDFVDDKEVSAALLDKIIEWGKAKGMDNVNGPVGFTDMDHQGLLIEGYDYLSPMASLYNYPYYVGHMEAYGLQKEMDWIEYRVTPPTQLPERMDRISKIIMDKFNLNVVKPKNARELKKRFGYTYFDVIDAAYQPLYNYPPLTDRQKRYYCNMYFPLLNFDFVTMITNKNDELVACGVGMPDISKALRKCKGKLFPFGWYYLLKELRAKEIDTIDLLLIAVRPDYQNMGINSLMFADQLKYFIKYKVKFAETTAILEYNNKSQANYEDFDKIQHKRRRAYVKNI